MTTDSQSAHVSAAATPGRRSTLLARLGLAVALLALPALASAQLAAAGDSKVSLSWTNPGGTVQVVILQSTATITDLPVNGTVYQPFTYNAALPNGLGGFGVWVPTAIGATQIAWVGSGTSVTCPDVPAVVANPASTPPTPTFPGSPLTTNGTNYFFKIFARNAAGVYTQVGPELTARPAAINTTTINTGTGDVAVTRFPGGAETILDTFAFATNTGTDTVTALTVTLSPPNAFANIASIRLTTTAGVTVGTPVANPATNSITFGGLSLPVTVGPVTYQVRITPKLHLDMPAVPGSTFDTQGFVTSYTCTNTKAGADSASSTVTIDNRSPGEATWGTLTPGNTSVTLNWAYALQADVARVVVLRNTASITDAPTEGVVPGAAINGSTVAYNSTTVATTTTSVTGLTNGSGYYFKIFVQDAAGNWSSGTETGPVLPGTSTAPVGNTIANTKAPVVSIVNPARGARVGSTTGSFRVQVRGFSPDNAGVPVPITRMRVRAYQGAPPATTAADDATLLPKSGTTSSGLWQRTISGLAPGNWTLDAEAQSAAGTIFSSPISVTVISGVGDGNLLVRDNSDQLCSDCHALASHSSETGNVKYGTWAATCRDCHAPHGTRNIFVVAESVTPPPRGAAPATAPKTVAFSTRTQTPSPADATTNRANASYANDDNTGACQVCHTLTKYYRADGTSPGGTHQTGNRCSDCHPHSAGMAVNCTTCHGTAGRASIAGADVNQAAAPPRGVLNESATTDRAVGAHAAHVNRATLRTNPLLCSDCHPATGNHDGTNTRDMAFGPLAKGTLSSVALTPAFDGTGCNATWCHGAGMPNGGGSITAPSWTGTNQATCGTCHGAPPTIGHVSNPNCSSVTCHGPGYTTAGISGAALVTHIDGIVQRPGAGSCTGCHGGLNTTPVATLPGVNAAQILIAPPFDTAGVNNPLDPHIAHINKQSQPVACLDCHGNIPVLGDPSHPDGNPFISLSQSVLGNQDSGFAVYAAGTCSSVYCHGGSFPVAARGSNITPTWTPGTLACGTCHGAPPGDALHASVNPALGLTSCARCHSLTVTAAGAIIPNGNHVNGFIEMTPTFAQSCADCHGTANRTALTQAVSHFEAAPPTSLTAASTTYGVGAHITHVNGTRSRNVECSTCHDGSAAFEANSPNYATMWTHADGVTDIRWATLARQNGAAPAYTLASGGSCGTTYCHGTTATPVWTSTTRLGCNACHGAATAGRPPYTAAGGFHPENNTCATCHTGYTANTVVQVRHVDGNVDVVALSCSTCHSFAVTSPFTATTGATVTTDVRVGAHATHLGAGGLAAALSCVDCHGAVPAAVTHADGQVLLNWSTLATGNGAAAAAPTAGPIPTGSTPMQCANYCHGGSMPVAEFGGTIKGPNWVLANQAVCGTCHFSGTVPASSTRHPKTDANSVAITTNTQCIQCHPDTVTAAGAINLASGKHVNGALDVTGGHAVPFAPALHSAAFFADQAACTGCHGATFATVVNSTHVPATSCNSCHADPASWGYTGVTGVTTWTTDCGFCHGNKARTADTSFASVGTPALRLNQIAPPEAVVDGNVSATTVVEVGAHLKHYSTTTSVKVQCTACHGAMPADQAHANGVSTVSWSTLVTFGGAAVSPAQGADFAGAWEATPTCTNYCHGATMTGGSKTNPSWVVPADGACGTCHLATPASAQGTHASHVNNASILGTNFVCNDCHSTVVSTANAITNGALHLNAIEEVSMLARGAQSSGTYTVAGGCAANYCHSSGQATPVYRAITWTAGAIGCNGCHGTGNTAGSPDYASGTAGGATANSHAAHTANGTDLLSCSDCHFNMVNATGTGIVGALHVNGSRNVAFNTAAGVAGPTAAYNPGPPKTCSNVACHGGVSVTWGGGAASVKCSDCHTAATDTDSFAFNDGLTGKINTTEWVQSGHGQPATISGGSQVAFGATGFLGTIAAGQPCLYCHDPAITHQTAANPFRLNGPVGAAGVVLGGNYNSSLANAGNDVCLNCHGTLSEPGVNPSVGGTPLGLRTAATKISSRHASHAGNVGGYRCWDCHDPHGDANVKMIGKKVVRTSADTNSFSATRVPAGATNVAFTGTTNRTNYYNATFSGICNACHTTAAHFTASANDAPHFSPQLCTDCHQHQGGTATSAFSPGASHVTPYPAAQHSADYFANRTSCASCHGANNDTLVGTPAKSCDTCHAAPATFGYVGVANANWETDCTFCHGSAARAADAAFANTAGPPVRSLVQAAPPEAVLDGVVTGTQVGAHLKHIATTGALKVQCTSCHGSPIASALTHIDATIALGWGTVATLGATVIPSPTLFNATWEATATCTNYCHGQTMVGGTRMTAARWLTPADGACGACHFTTGATATLAHAAHTNNAAILGANFACVDCHNSVVSAGGTIVGPTLHVNGGEEVAMGARNGQSNGTYTVAGGCTASYCHSSGTATPTYRGLTWTAPAIGCNGCHGTTNAAGAPDYASGTAGGASANNHLKHTANGVIGGATKCQDCHFAFVTAAGTAISGTSHVNGTRNVAFNVAVAGASAAYVTASKTCNSVNCHNNGTPLGGTAAFQTPAPVWGGTTTCSSCHAVIGADVGGSATSLSAKHGKHVTTYAYTCDECHAGTAAADSSAAILAGSLLHADTVKQVAFSASLRATAINQSAGTYSGSGGTCSASYCHSGGVATAAPFSATSSAALAWAGTATCRSCHGFDASAAPTIGVAAGSSFQGSAIHAAHVSNAAVLGTNYVCADCHANVIPTGNGTTANVATGLHVNGTKNVLFSTRGGATSGAYAAPNCATSYCHSDGRAAGTGQPVYRSVSWSTGTVGCNGCHGTTSAAGAPDYASGAAAGVSANSHAAHVGSPADPLSCKDCHFNLVAASGSAIVGALHTNGTRNVAFDTNVAGTTATYNPAVGTKTCSNVACHGSGTPTWGAAAGSVTCKSCHATAGNEFEDLGANFWANGVVSTISNTAWVYSGHGKLTGTYDVTANPAAAFSTTVAGTTECIYCHDARVLHGTSTNPFRLLGATTTGGSIGASNNYNAATDPNAVCNNCHKTGDFGVDPDGAAAAVLKNGTKNMDTAHDGAKHLDARLGGKFCWDCHDPHGDRNSNNTNAGENIAMIRSAVFAQNDGVYGYLGAAGITRPVTYNVQTAGAPGAGRSVEANTAVGTQHIGLCQACHAASSDTLLVAGTSVMYWDRLGRDDPDGPGGTAPANSSHNSTDTGTPYCVSCHSHSAKFAGGGDCTTCHENQTDDPAIPGVRRPIGPEFRRTWSHKRSAGGTVTKWDCIVCHMEGDPVSGDAVAGVHKNGIINLRDPDTGNNIKGVTFTAASGFNPGSYASTVTDATFTQFRRNLSSATLEATTQAIMINQCLACHDADGAFSPNARVPVAAMPGVSQYKPFGTTISGSGYSGANTAAGTVGGVTNVKASFATTNSSYHPVRGAQNNWYAKLNRMVAPWNGATRSAAVNTTSWGPLLTCWDCHAPTGATGLQTFSVTAHGGTVTLRGNAVATGTPTTANETTLCKVCHLNYNTCGTTADACGTAYSHGAGSALNSTLERSEKLPYFRYGCNMCHGSSYTVVVPRPDRAVDTHGVDVLPAFGTKSGRWATAGAKPYAFIRNSRQLGNHQPTRVLGTAYTAQCSGTTSPCSNGMDVYTPGGTY